MGASQQVGLTYFGKRYLSPYLGRWVSADPLAVHGLGGDFNTYAYVHGRVLSEVDPVGLQEDAGVPSSPVAGAPDQNPPDVDPAADQKATQKMLGNLASAAAAVSDFGSAVPAGVANSVTSTVQNAPRAAVEVARAAPVPAPLAALGLRLPMPSLMDQGLKTWERVVGRLELPHADTTAGEVGHFLGYGIGLTGLTLGSSAASAELGSARAAASATDCGTAEGYIYRGVSANHPAIEAARAGSAVPGDVAGAVSSKAHNAGNMAAKSPFTSWTHDPSIARFHALKDGPGGVILRVPQGAPPPGATWAWEWSEDEFGESEVLMRGVRHGVEVQSP